MSSNFDFLRNFDNDLHYLACIIEDEIYTSPSAVLTDATTFLEIIVYEIFKKNELEMDDLVYFKDKIMFLSQAGFLTPELKKHMLKAYSIRNKMHSYNGDAKNHIHLNQMRAVHIHRLLFNISWLYYIENSQEGFKARKPNYTHPSRLKDEILIKSEIGNGKCIICEKKTKSEDELFCRECKYKIEKSDNLKTLRKHFGFNEGFKRSQVIEIGFEKGYVGPFLQELKNDDLINTVGKLNFIDRENTNKYIEESESMVAIEKILSDFKLRNLGLKDIINHEFYLNGKNNQYPFVGFYNLFSELVYLDFISKINQDIKIEDLLNNSYLSPDELNEWYFKEETPEHETFNEKLIDGLINYKKSGLDVDFTVSDEILNAIKESNLYTQKEDEFLFSSFLKKTFSEKITKKEALESVGLTENDLEKFLVKYPNFNEKFEKSYTKRKMEKFLKHYDYYNYDYSLKKNGLTKEEIETWLEKSQNSQNELYLNFSNEYWILTLKKYVGYRKKGNTRYKALKKVNCDRDTVDKLLIEHDNDLDTYLVNESVRLFKEGKRKEDILTILDVTLEWFSSSIERGMNGEEIYTALYEEYSRNAIPTMMSEFMNLIKIKPLKNVLNELNISETELNNWCIRGNYPIPPYNEFYENFLEFKKETYVKTMIKTNSKTKALKKSYMTKEEFEKFEDELNETISLKSREIVMTELKKGNTTKKASKKASINITVIYDWLNKALNGDEDFTEFLGVYKKEYLVPIQRAYAEGVKKGASEKEIIRTLRRNDFLVNEDVKQLKLLDLFPKPGDKVIEMDENFEIDL